MEQLSRSEEQVMAALWACSRAATRREIASHLPPECRWADSTLLNFLLRLEKKNFVRTEKQGNQKSVHAAGPPPDLLRRGQPGASADALRR